MVFIYYAMGRIYQIVTGLLHIPNLIKKNYRFIIRVISLTMSKMVPILEIEREQWNGPRI
jgi:hypothetical protein